MHPLKTLNSLKIQHLCSVYKNLKKDSRPYIELSTWTTPDQIQQFDKETSAISISIKTLFKKANKNAILILDCIYKEKEKKIAERIQ